MTVLSELNELYMTTSFRIASPAGHVDIRIGNRHPAVDQLLEKFDAADRAYITAWNPRSKLVSPAQNEDGQEQLKRLLRDRGLHFYEGAGIPDTGAWTPETSVCVAGVGRQEAIEIGARFGQPAIVVGIEGGVAELVYCLNGKGQKTGV